MYLLNLYLIRLYIVDTLYVIFPWLFPFSVASHMHNRFHERVAWKRYG